MRASYEDNSKCSLDRPKIEVTFPTGRLSVHHPGTGMTSIRRAVEWHLYMRAHT